MPINMRAPVAVRDEAEQVAVEHQLATLQPVDELIDRLVAQARACAGELEPSGDLLGRPWSARAINPVP